MSGISARFGAALIEQVDRERGDEPRSAFIKKAVRHYLRARKLAAMREWAQKTADEDAQIAEALMDSLDGPIPE